MKFNIRDIKEALNNDKIQWSGHILSRMQQRNIRIKDIINCLSYGEIIEYYEDDKPYPSCLVSGITEGNRNIHVVCAYDYGNVWMITSYYPSKTEWLDDYKTRR